MHSQINFGYPWLISYGHLILAGLVLAILGVGRFRKWPAAAMAMFGLAAVWALTAWIMVRFGFDLNGRASMPTQAFLESGGGKVLDMGAGTGRSTLMVLEARPRATVVALDLFGNLTSSISASRPTASPPSTRDAARWSAISAPRASNSARASNRATCATCRSNPLPSTAL